MSNYSRACKDCGRWINIRQMPHGQWVPFEGDQQHVCDKPPPKKSTPPLKPRTPAPIEPPATPFKPFYPEVDPPAGPQPSPPRPAPPPAPVLRPTPTPQQLRPVTPAPMPVAPRPAPAPSPRTPVQDALRYPAPQKRRGMIGALLGVITSLLGSAFGLMIGVFGLLSLPLNVIAVMHLFGWTWFGALVGVILFACIPYIGQLGFLILAVMGGYYVWDANFDWHKAAYPPTKTFSIATLSEAELERFKTEVVRPGFEQACKSEALKTVGFNGKLPARAASQCECFATNFANKLTRADMMAFEKAGRYPDDLQQRLGTEVRRACQN
jgi:hypothetical protein